MVSKRLLSLGWESKREHSVTRSQKLGSQWGCLVGAGATEWWFLGGLKPLRRQPLLQLPLKPWERDHGMHEKYSGFSSLSSHCWFIPTGFNLIKSQAAMKLEKCCLQQSWGMSENGSVINKANDCMLFPVVSQIPGQYPAHDGSSGKFHWMNKDPLPLSGSARDPTGSSR